MIAGWLRLCHATTRWDIVGRDVLIEALEQGPVIIVLWHEHLMMGSMHWTPTGHPLMSLHDTSPIGKIAGAMEARTGLIPVAMSSKTSNLAMSRRIKREVQNGVSVGITADGPEGPARVVKTAPLDWARATGVPVFVYANAMTRHRRLGTWDRMVLPLPFTRGVGVFAHWDAVVPRRGTAEEMESLRRDLDRALTGVADQAEARLTAS